MENILIKYLNESKDLYRPEKATKGSAGFDLLASIINPLEIEAGKSLLVPCGFSLQMPNNFEAQVRPRSGLALKNSITVLNTPGTIDSDYRGEICVILINHGQMSFKINRGMRIAQIIFKETPEVNLVEVDELDNTKRGSGGFGSTGF
ncbi:MAG: dUTP diphosphatase [Alphaproteobacteria bacterium]|jgi:dUTP pyrophosphatase|tara:strand:- start:501 stop:944 length:444 start_codon:yes stop_codon:yes gene_type:complete